MKKDKIVRYSFDPLDPPPLGKEQQVRLQALAEMPDEAIDFSDIPAPTEDFWKGAVRGRFYKPVKQQVTLRLDANILAWFKRRMPKGYQTQINRALGDYIELEEKKARKKAG